MTTVYDISLKVAKEVMDVVEGTATGGSTSTLADTVLLAVKPNDHYNNGRLWIKSGTHANKVFAITDFTQIGGVVTFEAQTGAIVGGVRYAIAKSSYPWDQIVSAIQRALEGTYVTGLNSTLIGDGETLDFSLPTGVYDVKRVEFTDASSNERRVSTHWRETDNGKLRFDYGYAPYGGDVIHVYYRAPHAELVDYSTAISNEIDIEWLKYAATQELLFGFGIAMYGKQVEYRIEEKMNKVMQALKGKKARREIDIFIKTAGG